MTNISLDKNYFIKVIKDLVQMAEEKNEYFTKLDSEIGDGDHGINLNIGFREVSKQLSTWEDLDITSLFKKVGMSLLSKVGGSSGPLYGSFFMKFGVPAANKNEVDFNEFYQMFKMGIEAIESRGKAVVGEKTMVDALRPALDEFTKSIEEGLEVEECFENFVKSANEGAKSTIDIVATKGRAMRLGERAIGHMDPGAASACYILDVFNKNLKSYLEISTI
ncbi:MULTISPECIES: dihydroxyacetone kinase subunit DhaL [unclassified Romboutsia]|uniref:dihydroxyacetone kinase subunit DhaL n=1 Tax=unclassified Romboutsia TaxID=2626894 RepID=UPI000821CB4A|nr:MULTISPECIES: dihydroxyacetone kinase subunit DhaL [unclassified Romboutsia]SCH50867.1 PTS-dependent dihydroxyacetone kinase%2C ADP-binding subunit dhaL [uncultured Clostridium sp.]